MALPTGTFTGHTAIGNREDLSDMIFDVSPSETPFLSAIKKNKATATTHEWQTDVLTAPASDNAHLEGDDTVGVAITPTARLTNYTQILKKSVVVSGTQEEGVNPAGRKKEMAYQMARRMKEIKTDLESSMIGGLAVGNVKEDGGIGTAREMGSIYTYIATNFDAGTNGVASSGDGTDLVTAGTDRDLTETILQTVLSECYESGGNPKQLFVSGTNKSVVSGFTGGGTRYVDTDDKKLVNSIDVYVGDFHTLQVVPSRQIIGDNVLAIDPEYVAFSELRSLKATDLAKTGDSTHKQLVWEGTLEVCNEKAHGLICDTDG